MQTPDWLSHDNPEALAEAIKRRIQGKLGPRPGRDEWAWTEPVLSLVERSTEEPERSLMAKAILLLLGELSESTEQQGEWPAGLLSVARRVSWSKEEMVRVCSGACDLLENASEWPLGRSSGEGLGSPALEVYRFARFAWTPWCGLGPALESAVRRLGHDLAGMQDKGLLREAQHELGSLLGLQLSLYGTGGRGISQGFDNGVIPRSLISEYEGWTDADLD